MKAVQKNRKNTPYGQAQPKRAAIGEKDVVRILSNRLEQKYLNYESIATRLEFKGETDAAQVLRRAAARLRLIQKDQSSDPDVMY